MAAVSEGSLSRGQRCSWIRAPQGAANQTTGGRRQQPGSSKRPVPLDPVARSMMRSTCWNSTCRRSPFAFAIARRITRRCAARGRGCSARTSSSTPPATQVCAIAARGEASLRHHRSSSNVMSARCASASLSFGFQRLESCGSNSWRIALRENPPDPDSTNPRATSRRALREIAKHRLAEHLIKDGRRRRQLRGECRPIPCES